MIKRPRKWCIQKKTYFDKQYFIRRLVIIPQAGAFHGVLQIFDRIRKDKLKYRSFSKPLYHSKGRQREAMLMRTAVNSVLHKKITIA